MPWWQDSDLNGVVAVRYTGGARMLLLIELGRHRRGGMRIKVPAIPCPRTAAEPALQKALRTKQPQPDLMWRSSPCCVSPRLHMGCWQTTVKFLQPGACVVLLICLASRGALGQSAGRALQRAARTQSRCQARCSTLAPGLLPGSHDHAAPAASIVCSKRCAWRAAYTGRAASGKRPA